MSRLLRPIRIVTAVMVLAAPMAFAQSVEPDFGAIFDEHWERMRKDYPYFELYGVDWEAERAEHRPRAVAAENATEFAWEMARLLTVLDDAHVSYRPPIDVMKGWAIPDVRFAVIERRAFVLSFGDEHADLGPARYRHDPRAYPEVVSVEGARLGCAAEILAAGPVGTSFEVRLRWPDGTETDERISRPDESNLPPKKKHFGERWIHSGRVGSIGYLRVRTFDPKLGTLGPEGKMTPILREHLRRLRDTDGLILDLRSNGGGLVAASDPFLRHFLDRRMSYRWGNSDGRSRILSPRSPRYRSPVVALVDEKSASGGEWAARILKDAGRAVVVGGRTMGAEAAVLESNGSDGSIVAFSGWPMVEPGVTPFQEVGVELDHAIPLTIDDVREHGYDEARERVRRARFRRALDVIGAPEEDLDAFLALASESESETETPAGSR